jgi:chromosome segregation ATPase
MCASQVYKTELEGCAIREKELLTQLQSFSGKFQDVDKVLQESNGVFAKFKLENDKLTKALKRSEGEGAELRRKVHSSDSALLRLLEERRDVEGALKKARARGDTLEMLCRTLQEERKGLSGPAAATGPVTGAGVGAALDTPPGKVSFSV